MNREKALKIAKWWSEKSFTNPANKDNGDDSPNGGIAAMLGAMITARAQESITPEKIDLFEQKLADLIMERDPYHISVDYHPDQNLTEAAEHAGIDTDVFPWKSYVYAGRDGGCTGRCGYSGQTEVIY